jgi:hypothetical protein
MAAPQFSKSGPSGSPKNASKGAEKVRRSFTLDEANRALALVSRVVRDIVNTNGCVAQLQAKLEGAKAKEAKGVQGQLDAAVDRLQEYVDELGAIGVELKDFDMGLVDFPGRHQGRDVYLCWKLGEDKVGHWHELHTGYTGRQPVRSLIESE